MAGMTKSQIAEHLSEKTGTTKKVGAQFLEELATWPTSRPRTPSPSRASASSSW